ncbi:MAG: ferric reductase-like transmembrane domain-containing protein [Gammaproteobacteria bacterium]|nr:ferric reductase-like transmembrane domain-containing protein [Gammaproteobacteria bacterium]
MSALLSMLSAWNLEYAVYYRILPKNLDIILVKFVKNWQIPLWTMFGLSVLAVSVYLTLGWSEAAIRSYVRMSAQISFVLFMLAFSASSLQALFRRGWTAVLLRNRRYIGLSFAVSHTGHLLALFMLAAYFPHPFLDRLSMGTILGGTLAYVIIAMMTITSFEIPRRRLGERYWKWLHLYGSWYLWILFAYSYIPRAMKTEYYIPFAVLLSAVLFLRIARAYKYRQASSKAEPV